MRPVYNNRAPAINNRIDEAPNPALVSEFAAFVGTAGVVDGEVEAFEVCEVVDVVEAVVVVASVVPVVVVLWTEVMEPVMEDLPVVVFTTEVVVDNPVVVVVTVEEAVVDTVEVVEEDDEVLSFPLMISMESDEPELRIPTSFVNRYVVAP